MKSYARVTLNSLSKYKDCVQQVNDYTLSAFDVVSAFDDLTNAINKEINKLQEKKAQLADAQATLKEKIAECEKRLEQLRSYINQKKNELESVCRELASTPKTITISVGDNTSQVPNPQYFALLNRKNSIEMELMNANKEFAEVELRLNRCNLLSGELNATNALVDKRISLLETNISSNNKNKDQFINTLRSLRNSTTNAISKLSMIKKTLDNYTGIRMKVSSAFDSVNKDLASKNLDSAEYLSPRFKNIVKTSADSKKNQYDDQGKLFRNADGLIPNNTVIYKGFTFQTDHSGRLIAASGKLRKMDDQSDRKWDSTIKEIGQGYERKDDDRGHAIPHRFGGPDSIINAFPQDSSINRGEFKSLENELASEVNNGREVFYKVTPIYKGDSHRPVGIAVHYSVDGVSRMRFFNNKS